MKYLIMCEGSNELEIVSMLLEHKLLALTEDDLLGLRPYHARQIKKSSQVQLELNLYPENDVMIYRIGDKQSDKLIIPGDYKDKIVGVEKYCTKPELEMLLILAAGLESEYTKVKSKISPKDFAKANIRCDNRRYDNKSSFYRDYFGNDIALLVSCIHKYRLYNGSHGKDEHYLAELLR